LVKKIGVPIARILFKAQCFHIMVTMITKIKENFEVLFRKIIWSLTVEEVLATSNFTSTSINKKLVNKILIKCTSVH
jgi:hypothetical protein